jgi:DNA-binding NtrC family response regulator
MQTSVTVPVQQRAVVVVTPDVSLRQSLTTLLSGMRWDVSQASGGAEAMMHMSRAVPEAMIVDHWLPDLDAGEFSQYVATACPGTDLLQMDGRGLSHTRSARRNELLHALREAEDARGETSVASMPRTELDGEELPDAVVSEAVAEDASAKVPRLDGSYEIRMNLPDIVGDSPGMRDLAASVRLVAPHMANVLILGETGTGKELVAKAVHRLSARAGKPFAVLNCAAIPEHLLEAELFGHTRGAFTGAITSRMGRIEAAHGGTLFLDEIGEMPVALQAKMLRFLENGEIQKVGENESIRVDVRIVAATHQPLEQQAMERRFRLDLYHRLAVFPVEIPPLRERREDIPMLVEHTLRRLGETMPRKSIREDALQLLLAFDWPGNVRELGHMVHRAVILCGDESVIRPEHVRLSRTMPN